MSPLVSTLEMHFTPYETRLLIGLGITIRVKLDGMLCISSRSRVMRVHHHVFCHFVWVLGTRFVS